MSGLLFLHFFFSFFSYLVIGDFLNGADIIAKYEKNKKRSFSDLNASKKKQNKTKAKPHLKQNHNFY